jgi:ankyrin repeat protein
VGGDVALLTFMRAITRGQRARASSLLAAAPELAVASVGAGEQRFLEEISHAVYRGDTALHIAAAAYDAAIVHELVNAGAIARAANRRGAEPLHYAVDGIPGSARWDPAAQRETVSSLVALGADPDALDKNGTAPLHRAVRNRCAAAVEALLGVGADPRAANGKGSTPIQLAHWTTGRGGSGSPGARAEQAEIVRLLRAAGVT